MNDLRNELSTLADQAAPADLLDRVYGTSRKFKRRRQALVTGVAGGLAAALIFGFTSSGGTTSKDEVGPLTTPSASATTPVLPGMKPFVPPTTQSGGRTIMPVVLPDGTEVRFSYPSGLGLRFSGMEAGYNGVDLEIGVSASPVIKADAKYIRNVTDASGQQLELWKEPKEPGNENDIDVYSVRVGSWFVGLGELADETGPDPVPDLRRMTFSVDSRGFYEVSGDPVAKVKLTYAGDASWTGPIAHLAVKGSETKTLHVRRVANCTGADREREGELRGPMVCKDGAAVDISATGDEQNWTKQVKSGLRIESVKAP
jgi:hypothetical protein